MPQPREEPQQEPKKETETKPASTYRPPTVLKSSSPSGSKVISAKPEIIKDKPPAVEQELVRILSYLQNSSEIWTQISDTRIKMLIVSRYIDLYRRQGVVIRKPVIYYTQLIDSMSSGNSTLLHQPFARVLEVAAILEYDFNNGQNKDALALKILGSREAVMKNRERLMRMQQGGM